MELKLPDKVRDFMSTVSRSGYEIYAVGGSVRDLLLGRNTADTARWDFTTNATPQQIQEIFPDSFYDNTFGTVGVKIKSKKGETEEIYEITTYRKEGKYSDRRHPDEVVWGRTIEEDLARRDLTINAIALSYSHEKKSSSKSYRVVGEENIRLVDYFGGREDLRQGIIRAVGNPEDRFAEDALRMLRAVRFAVTLQFTIEEKTFDAIRENAVLLEKISGERIREEMVKILSSDYPADGIKLLYNAGLLEYILPELVKGVGIRQPGHHIHDVFTHSVESLRYCKNPAWLVRLATLIHDIGKPVAYKELDGKPTFYNHEVVGAAIAKSIAQRWHLSRQEREKLYILVRWHMFTVSELLTDAAIRRFIRRVGPENTADMLDLRIGDRLGSGSRETSWRLEKFKQRIIEVQKHTPSVNDLAVDGHDVMRVLGTPPGPKVGEILNKLFAEIMENPAKNKREYLLSRIRGISN